MKTLAAELPARNAPAASYFMAHYQVQQAFGKAADQECVECGRKAQDWSYNHNDPDEMVESAAGSARPFSMNVAAYSPRCRRCHAAYDEHVGDHITRAAKAEAREAFWIDGRLPRRAIDLDTYDGRAWAVAW